MVFKLFYKTNPKCLDNCDVRFFHDAFRKCDTEVLELMIQANPRFLYQHDPNYPKSGLPIHQACNGVMCEKINLLLHHDKSQAKQVVNEDSKMLPLHMACHPFQGYSIFNIETFKHLYNAYPEAAKEKDAKGCLPLHYACMQAFFRPDNQNFVSELLEFYPDAAHIRDKQEYFPLNYVRSFDIQIEKDLIILIAENPEALLQSGHLDQLILGTLAKFRCTSHQVWHTAGRLCPHAFILATLKSWQPLHQISCELPTLVENFVECPLDWTKNEGKMQDGELAGIILHYTYEALLQANHGLDSKSNLPSSGNVVRPCLPDDNNYSTFKTTLLHQLAYCSNFCELIHLKHAVDSYVSRQSVHFHQADNNGNLPLHLVCCAPPPRGSRKKIRANLVESFLTPYIEAASKINHLGKTPLDILMKTYSELSGLNIDSWHGVELLVEANPTEANKLFTKEKIYPFMLAAIGEQADLSFTFSMLLSFVLVQI